ncbi:hypothetical protein [Bacillus aerolatus]|uniref:hypothetical protein n=1 Tax=Bacillus aerolatus TaxID=2653354 RepID=UPI00177B8F86|nr:hypothetical protein [Bacillus aerolatus]
MVNLDFESFRKQQANHKAVYAGSTKERPVVDDKSVNGPEDADSAPGATGRNIQK